MSSAPSSRPVGLWVGLALGGPVLAFGIAGAITDAARTRPIALAGWVVGAAVAHDVVFAPFALATAWSLARLRRGRVPGWLGWAVATSAVLVLFAWPLVRGYGRNPTVPSLLPRDYTAGLIGFLVGVWAVAILLALTGRLARARGLRPRSDPSPGPADSHSPDARRAGE